MGPFIPQGLINPELSLFFAFVIGLGFGYVLEQAGFSNSTKLAGVFYGYDFVVLRVFFTAAVTAAVGLLLFDYMGWVEYDLMYINPTFLKSAIVGGVIMGFGFILGGYCPGTSVAGAVIGKIDAMFYLVGILAGIFFFGTFYETFKPLYTADDLGDIVVYDSLGMNRDLFMFIFGLIALTSFVVTKKIEDKVNGITPPYKGLFHPSYNLPFFLLIALITLNLVLPGQPRSKWYETPATTLLDEAASGKYYVGFDEVAYKMLHEGENDLLLVDVRGADDFSRFSLPGAVNVPLKEILGTRAERLIQKSDKKVVLYSYSSSDADQAWMLLRRAGFRNIHVLKDGLNGFYGQLFDEKPVTDNEMASVAFETRFRERAAKAFKTGEAAEKTVSKGIPVTTIVDIIPPKAGKGGC
ncbi:MAG: YeeE/YedE family protein [Bacteroidales bacterium]|nr:YeeE/YedE family protein [Bacteroidales bacterium]